MCWPKLSPCIRSFSSRAFALSRASEHQHGAGVGVEAATRSYCFSPVPHSKYVACPSPKAMLCSHFCFLIISFFFFSSGKMVFLQKRHPTPSVLLWKFFKVTNCISLSKINNLKTWSVISKKKYEAWCVYSINVCLIDGVLVASPSKVTFSNSAVTVWVRVRLYKSSPYSFQHQSITRRQCKRLWRRLGASFHPACFRLWRCLALWETCGQPTLMLQVKSGSSLWDIAFCDQWSSTWHTAGMEILLGGLTGSIIFDACITGIWSRT